MGYIIIKYIHLVAILVLFASLVAEHLLIRKKLSAAELSRLAAVDRIYGISAVVVLLAGLALWFVVGKAASFYTANPVFHAKLTLFVIVGLLSIYPTRFFLRERRSGAATVVVPGTVVAVLRIELVLVLVLPLLGVLMAQGYGLSR